ncbi:telomerase protein component 1-like [Nyctibius grandis]|uniref:telomerase protein component 1-like n=1 Tax=Nyctibius grandis TaxID=48427 RepID=UPI0035BBA8C0
MAAPPNPEVSPEVVEELKLELLAAIGSSLVPGADLARRRDPLRGRVLELCARLAPLSPEFLLQAALFARRALGLRAIGCFLVAVAAGHAPCRPLLRRYLGGVALLPRDWADVPRYYQSLAPHPGVLAPLPRALRDALAAAFARFDPHQVAKYRGRPGKVGPAPSPGHAPSWPRPLGGGHAP